MPLPAELQVKLRPGVIGGYLCVMPSDTFDIKKCDSPVHSSAFFSQSPGCALQLPAGLVLLHSDHQREHPDQQRLQVGKGLCPSLCLGVTDTVLTEGWCLCLGVTDTVLTEGWRLCLGVTDTVLTRAGVSVWE